MQIRTKFRAVGLLDYAKQGKEALQHIKRALYASLNAGRRVARQRISSEFQTRTGFLRRQAGKMRPQLGIFMQRRARRGAPSKGSATPYEIGGRITPIPKLMNIFERGATLAHGRGFLRARPIVGPAQEAIDQAAMREFKKVMDGIGR